jgi:hypothetical protein
MSEKLRWGILSTANIARNLAINVPRQKYLEQRIARISELVRERKPKFLLCYGTSRRREYEKIVGGPFDNDGFRDFGSTVCANRHASDASLSAADGAGKVGRIGLRDSSQG